MHKNSPVARIIPLEYVLKLVGITKMKHVFVMMENINETR